MTLPQGQLGYSIELERRFLLESSGAEPALMLKQYRDSFPTMNLQADPTGAVKVLDQGQQGSCQGHSLAQCFSICFYLATGRYEAFSRACGYYVAQQYDGIRSDSGSTLSGGNKVATQHGMCLEKDWPYPSRYNPAKPTGITFPFKMKVSRPLRTVDEMRNWLDAGLPVQTGIAWNDSCNQEVVDNWRSGGGGHSTTLWTLSGDKVNNINSWGRNWNGDGVHKWTWGSIERMLRHEWSTFIGYAPDEMSFPVQEPLV